jgi:Putative DNA-binding domain
MRLPAYAMRWPVPLAEAQARVATALVTGSLASCTGLLAGGRDPMRRLAVHVRHYHASLTRAIVERFPATVWLGGSELVIEAAREFVRTYPPTRPCLAEYGDAFPAFLGAWAKASHLPYLAQFASIDWHLGRLAIATDDPPIILRLDWSLDELVRFFLSDQAPEAYVLRAETVWLELRGARGELSVQRCDPEV